MDKINGYVWQDTIGTDAEEIWFKILVCMNDDQKTLFDCRIATDSMSTEEVEKLANQLCRGRYVELDGYMMFDCVDRGNMSIWFSVWDVSVGVNEMVNIYKSKETPPN